ncbi:tetraacyldisaccharide 4'-kinase [Reichenbachiella sp. MALMAid0571]|uniref:tetraacyldisaccharide 4'-kinase n=1 Tax=Reichenbachiella sp. MALMAid0571 TaxID=3143939 RepID=UPI0032DFC346
MKFLLFPFALIYGWVTSLRNHLYDIGTYKSVAFDVNVISVGNLTVGGTGKSPMVEYIVRLLERNEHKPAILSRGYKRKTRGFRLANDKDTAVTLGDEPFQFWLKFGNKIPVAVGEERVMAIPEILFEHEDCDVVVCDDAFQHRTLRPNLNVLLSTYGRPFFEDHLMPYGRLREARNGASRADILVFTKCQEQITSSEAYVKEARKYLRTDVPVFFTKTKYQAPIAIFSNELEFVNKVILVSGLADSKHLVEYVEKEFDLLCHLEYGDHHHFSKSDMESILTAYNQGMADGVVSILTTEKDATKIREFKELSSMPVFYLPIEIEFLDEGDKFEQLIVDSFKNEPQERIQ